MPKTEDYQTSHRFHTPQPSCVPGYTGYIPQQRYQVGKSSGQTSHLLMKDHPVAGLRLSSIGDYIGASSSTLEKRLGVESMVWRHETQVQNARLGSTMVVGYTGHVPRRKKFVDGKNFYDACKEAVARMENLKNLRK